MRSINATNFEQSNVEFIEFWVLDTFNEIESNNNELGELVFHLGNISEDILRDGRKRYEMVCPLQKLQQYRRLIEEEPLLLNLFYMPLIPLKKTVFYKMLV